MSRRTILPFCAAILFLLAVMFPVPGHAADAAMASAPQVATLEECLQKAMENSHRRPATRFSVEMAEAQHHQALSAYWPQVGARGGYQRMDEYPNFLFPAARIHVPAGSATIHVPAQLVNPAAPPGAMIPLPVSTPEQDLSVPEQDIQLMDETSFMASLQATWLLYDGGMRRGFREQTESLVEMMKQESRRTDLEISDSVRRLYYGAVLAAQLHQVGSDTLARMEATLNLTETMYKEGSGKVKKTDWLENKVTVESLRAMVALLEKNELMARAALANTMGMPWHASVKPADTEIPFAPFREKLDGLVGAAYRFNPDWSKIEAGIRAAEGAVRTARSGHHPKLAVTGDLHKWWNDYDAGMATDRNKEGWTVGVGVEIPIFSGFLTKNKVAETRARVAKIKEEQFLLKEGIGLQIRDTFLALGAAEKSHQATLDAMTAAEQNRDLNTRAYQHELVETEKVIRAQLMEALMSAQHYKARYDHVALQSQLNLVVGTEVLKKLEG
ncbi:TolC family protein [Desulfococcus sp.]|uniref:TolC family protein n=1 Tax=Desulfococcus sp. TaxID=2025834 RepID=UPI0035931D49